MLLCFTVSDPAAFILLQFKTVAAVQAVFPLSTPPHIRHTQDLPETHIYSLCVV